MTPTSGNIAERENGTTSVTIYPNPTATGKINLHLEMKEAVHPKLLTITNILGEVFFY